MEVTAEELLAMSTTSVTSVGSCRTTRPGFSVRSSASSNPSLLGDASIAVPRLRAFSTVGPLLNSHTSNELLTSSCGNRDPEGWREFPAITLRRGAGVRVGNVDAGGHGTEGGNDDA
jgi:hypothetical protein